MANTARMTWLPSSAADLKAICCATQRWGAQQGRYSLSVPFRILSLAKCLRRFMINHSEQKTITSAGDLLPKLLSADLRVVGMIVQLNQGRRQRGRLVGQRAEAQQQLPQAHHVALAVQALQEWWRSRRSTASPFWARHDRF